MNGPSMSPGELILETLNNIKQEAVLKGQLRNLQSVGVPEIASSHIAVSYDNEKIVNNEIMMVGRNAKKNYYAMKEKELVLMITLNGVLLFSAVLMLLNIKFANQSWILALIVSGACIVGVLVAVYGIKDFSIIDGTTFNDKSNKDPLDATIAITMPFIIFTIILVIIAAAASGVIWWASKKNAQTSSPPASSSP